MMENPVLVKELRTQMRGARAFAIVCVYNLILLIVVTLSGVITLSTAAASYYTEIGRSLFYVIIFLQMGLVCLMSPAFTAGAITSERGQRTFDLLITTLITPSQIIFGKVGSSLLYVLLLLGGSLPLVSLLFLLGGFSPGEVFMSYYFMFLTAAFLSFAAFMFSTLFRRTAVAQAFSNGFMLAVTIVTVALGSFFFAVPGTNFAKTIGEVLFIFNPFLGLYSTIERQASVRNWFNSAVPTWVLQTGLYIILSVVFFFISRWRLPRIHD
jgi:ABC-type transport system involved in multi-copper enzyme maturation permease subunit